MIEGATDHPIGLIDMCDPTTCGKTPAQHSHGPFLSFYKNFNFQVWRNFKSFQHINVTHFGHPYTILSLLAWCSCVFQTDTICLSRILDWRWLDPISNPYFLVSKDEIRFIVHITKQEFDLRLFLKNELDLCLASHTWSPKRDAKKMKKPRISMWIPRVQSTVLRKNSKKLSPNFLDGDKTFSVWPNKIVFQTHLYC